jgi:hypothetical protein
MDLLRTLHQKDNTLTRLNSVVSIRLLAGFNYSLKFKNMNAIIEISSSYGFDHNWTLVISRGKQVKSFYLGQDCKFLSRVLGIDAKDVIQAIGTNDLRPEAARKKLAKYIIEALNLDAKQVKELQAWELCCQ